MPKLFGLGEIDKIQVFIDCPYTAVENMKKLYPRSRREFYMDIQNSRLPDLYKSDEFKKILWWIYSHAIPFHGVDINDSQAGYSRTDIGKYIYAARKLLDQLEGDRWDKLRNNEMNNVMNLLRIEDRTSVFLAYDDNTLELKVQYMNPYISIKS